MIAAELRRMERIEQVARRARDNYLLAIAGRLGKAEIAKAAHAAAVAAAALATENLAFSQSLVATYGVTITDKDVREAMSK